MVDATQGLAIACGEGSARGHRVAGRPGWPLACRMWLVSLGGVVGGLARGFVLRLRRSCNLPFR